MLVWLQKFGLVYFYFANPSLDVFFLFSTVLSKTFRSIFISIVLHAKTLSSLFLIKNRLNASCVFGLFSIFYFFFLDICAYFVTFSSFYSSTYCLKVFSFHIFEVVNIFIWSLLSNVIWISSFIIFHVRMILLILFFVIITLVTLFPSCFYF